ncbi:hypothetical protein E2C01_094692 [Portunus trituberculatus]|uniref:Uncharacterized protein n=1 Tax=Portunus trituberculatus TaxID=210409 RepID=A0A5B7K1I9_PORTR|nr:hypothetical protein [Portunus trituberculatus]
MLPRISVSSRATSLLSSVK